METSRAEAERLLGIAEKLLRNKDLASCKDFAVLAQETEPLLEGSDQILSVAEVLLAAEKRVNNQNDWYAILQIGQRTDDAELIKKQYRRLALLLHPDKNKFAFADSAFRLVADAWSVLSDSGKKSVYDNEFSVFTKVDLAAMRRQKDLQQQSGNQSRPQQSANQSRQQQQAAGTDLSQQKLPVRRSARGGNSANNSANADGGSNVGAGRKSNLGSNVSKSTAGGGRGRMSPNFWTVCPYCYHLYEYPRMYEGCCFRCQNCEKAFTGMEVHSKPPTIPGTETYYCCWGFFPMGFSGGVMDGEKSGDGAFQNWMPPMFPSNNLGQQGVNVATPVQGVNVATPAQGVNMATPVQGVPHGSVAGGGVTFAAGAVPGGGAGVIAGGVVGGGVGIGGGVMGGSGSSAGGAGGSKGNASAKEGAKKRGRPRKNL